MYKSSLCPKARDRFSGKRHAGKLARVVWEGGDGCAKKRDGRMANTLGGSAVSLLLNGMREADFQAYGVKPVDKGPKATSPRAAARFEGEWT